MLSISSSRRRRRARWLATLYSCIVAARSKRPISVAAGVSAEGTTAGRGGVLVDLKPREGRDRRRRGRVGRIVKVMKIGDGVVRYM
jgi:hypothetical protein